MPKGNVSIDMTPMVDMAFLLVTFFILTSVSNPPEHGKVIITIADDGRLFFDLDNQNFRRSLIQKMGEDYNITFTVDEVTAFATGSSLGVPMGGMKNYLSMSPEERKKVEQCI